jgi:RNA polymerase sigma-70 factor (ECF subfamily)
MGNPQPDSAETESLLHRAGAGDRQAFNFLFAEHRAFLRQVVELRIDRRLRARVDPSDVVQEAQLEAYRRLSDYLDRRPMPFRLWLRKTTFERLLKIERRHVQAAQRSVKREAPLPEQSSLQFARRLLARGATPSQRLDACEMARRIREAVARLPEIDREVVLMRNFEGLSNHEVACLLSLDPATASKRHGRALLRLRQILVEDGVKESQLWKTP